ncbi:hypothetical protein KP509_38G015000 [Ceratopteris richardii]|uniref:Protein kinase domain-containing protein n=1 Tax=Ceratopteris richardii TaxID=49495 RepID=A0A8T2Q1T6_CERRI|nr:hypothetical protein KP509_38G015000 [Ceratopteris richardii]
MKVVHAPICYANYPRTGFSGLLFVVSMSVAATVVGALQQSADQPDCITEFKLDLSDDSNIEYQSLIPNSGIPYKTPKGIFLNYDPSITTSSVPRYNVGRIRNKFPLAFKCSDGGSRSLFPSFTTSFTFQIKTFTKYNDSGDGIAFALTTDAAAPENSTGRFLGLMQQKVEDRHQQFMALEFDTFQNFEPGFDDPSASHVGIDVGNLTSLKPVKDTSDPSDPLYLYQNYTITTWLFYNSSDPAIYVWATNDTDPAEKPLTPILGVPQNLSQVFQNDTSIYAVITAASGNNSQAVILYSWNLTIIDHEDLKEPKRRPWKLLYLLIAVPFIALLALAAVRAICIWRVNHRSGTFLRDAARPVRRFTYSELLHATSWFTEEIGRGGCSVVYRGNLQDGTPLAIKKMKNAHADVTVIARELQILSGLQHRNLLSLRGWCFRPEQNFCCRSRRAEIFLIFEYMPNGTLHDHLRGAKEDSALDSARRLSIIHDVAIALEFLHSYATPTGFVAHRDVKAQNVLLTENMEAKLGDFGLARLSAHHEFLTENPAGTVGYAAPEAFRGQITEKSDVYSFGVLMIEIASGMRPSGDVRIAPHTVLADWLHSMTMRNNIMEAIDTSLNITATESERWRSVLRLALACCQPEHANRPSMRKVVNVLENPDAEILEVSD